MRTRTQLSNLAIAAIAILAAATTSFAQTNDERGAATASFVAVSGTELTASNNATQPTSIESAIRESFTAKNASETRTSVKAPAPATLSAATFSPEAFSAGSRFATVNAERFLSQQQRAATTMSVKAPSAPADEFSETKTRSVEFVPSRIPKFPYREN